MKFEEVLPAVREGKAIRRGVFHNSLIVFMQVPATIDPSAIANMQSIPSEVKWLLNLASMGISYNDQFIMYDFADGTCTYYPFDGNDLNADDWEVVNPLTYNPYE